jgi:hypothetical protein
MSTFTPAEPVRRRGGFGFALILIGIGLAALLSNLGYLTVSWVAMLALWPLLLVIAGVDLLLAHRAPLAALALDVVVVTVGLVLLATRPFTGSFAGIFPFVNIGDDCPSGAAQSSVSVPKPSDTGTAYTLRFTGGAGTYTITGGSSQLVEASSDNADLYLRTSGIDVRVTSCTNAGFRGSRNVQVKVADDVPVTLELTGGAGTFNLDLRTTQLKELRATNGAATMEIDLPKPSGNVPVRITGGASTVTVSLGGAEASVDVTGGLTALHAPGGVDGGTFAGREHWQSQGYDTAKDRFTITVTGGASTINVQ